MYIMANDVMKRTTLPVEMYYFQYGYKYTSINVGYSSYQLCTNKNYKISWQTAWDGTTMSYNEITGFEWCFALDDYDIYDSFIEADMSFLGKN